MIRITKFGSPAQLPSRAASNAHRRQQDSIQKQARYLRRLQPGSGRAICVLMVALAASLLSGCAISKVRLAYETHHNRPLEIVKTVEKGSDPNQAPYQLAVRITPDFLERSALAMLPENLLEGEKFTAEAPAKMPPRPPTSPAGPFAGFGGFIREKLEATRQSMTPTITPHIKPKSVDIQISHQCNGCLFLDVGVVGSLEGVGSSRMDLGGNVRLNAKIGTDSSTIPPSLAVELRGIEALHLDIPGLPAFFAPVQQQMEKTMAGQINAWMLDDPTQNRVTVPLDQQMDLGSGISLAGVGISTHAGTHSEIFVGLNSSLNAAGKISPNQLGNLRHDWALMVSEEVIERMMQAALRDGSMPSRFDRHGEPDPEGPVAFELDQLHFTPEGFEIRSTMFYMAFPAWWREFTIRGGFELVGSQIVPRIEEMEPGEGGGAKFLAGVVKRKATSERAMQDLDETLPAELPLQPDEQHVLLMKPRVLKTMAGQMMLEGNMEVQTVTEPIPGALQKK